MIFTETELKDAYIVEIEKHTDEGGFFARAWCNREFEERGVVPNIAQSNLSFSKKVGTLRGMHYQGAPFEETKLIRCTKGAIYMSLLICDRIHLHTRNGLLLNELKSCIDANRNSSTSLTL